MKISEYLEIEEGLIDDTPIGVKRKPSEPRDLIIFVNRVQKHRGPKRTTIRRVRDTITIHGRSERDAAKQLRTLVETPGNVLLPPSPVRVHPSSVTFAASV